MNRALGWCIVAAGVAFAEVTFGWLALPVGAGLTVLGWHLKVRAPVKTVLAASLVMVVIGPRFGPTAQTAQQGFPDSAVTPTIWAQALLGGLGDPATSDNLRAVTAWEAAEGGHWNNDAAHNPLNTTQPEPGSWPVNSVGVQAYPTWDVGMTATLSTLGNGQYGAVLAALRAGNCAACVAAAVGASPWGTGDFAV